MRRKMGWKTIFGAVVNLIGGILTVTVSEEIGSVVTQCGESLIAVGLGHKLVKLIK